MEEEKRRTKAEKRKGALFLKERKTEIAQGKKKDHFLFILASTHT